MALPLSYNVRNVRNRWQVTLLAISGSRWWWRVHRC
jgi:hypothetical protein